MSCLRTTASEAAADDLPGGAADDFLEMRFPLRQRGSLLRQIRVLVVVLGLAPRLAAVGQDLGTDLLADAERRHTRLHGAADVAGSERVSFATKRFPDPRNREAERAQVDLLRSTCRAEQKTRRTDDRHGLEDPLNLG